MRALVLNRYGKRESVALADIERPVPRPNEILVAVHAAGLNPIDNTIPKGMFKPILPYRLPITLGSDVAGVVAEVGSGVTRFKRGDAVFASTFDQGNGAFAELAVVPEHCAALKPANLSFVEAASIPMVGLTTWQALKLRAQIKSGQKVFIPAGAGGIGSFAIQLAKHLDAKVGTTTSTGNIDLLRGLGADEIVDYKRQEFERVLTDYDAVLGTIRGDGVEKSLRILKSGGTVISLVGPPDAAFARARGMNALMRFVFGLLSHKIISRATKRGIKYSFLFVYPDGKQLAEIGALLAAGVIRPVIDKVFPFVEIKEALAYLEQGRAKGKVVVQMK